MSAPQAAAKPSLAARFKSRWLSDQGLTKRAYLNTLTEGLDYAARLLVGFLITPLLLTGLGSFAFGVWQVLDRLTGHLNTAGNRPFQTLKWTLAQQNTSRDYDAKRRQVGSAVIVWLLVALPLSLIAGALAWQVPVWLSAPPEHFFAVRTAALLLAANLLLISLADLPRSVLIGENLSYKRMGLSPLLVLIGGGLTALALYFDTGLAGVAAAVLTVSLLTGLLFLWVSYRHVSWLGVAKPSAQTVKKFLQLSGWFFCWSLVMVVIRAGDVVILAALDSVDAVTHYALTRYVPETAISLIAMVAFGVTPGLGGIVGAGDLPRAAALRAEVMSFSWLLLAGIGATLVVWNRSFVSLWVGADHYAGALPSLLIVVTVVQFVFIRNDAFLIELTLNMRRKVLLGVVAAVASVAAAALLVSLGFGISGLCLGLIIGRSLLSISYPWLIGGYFNHPLSEQLRGAARPAVALLLILAVAFRLEPYCQVDSWLALIAVVIVTYLVVTAIAYFIGLAPLQRRRLARRLTAVFSK